MSKPDALIDLVQKENDLLRKKDEAWAREFTKLRQELQNTKKSEIHNHNGCLECS